MTTAPAGFDRFWTDWFAQKLESGMTPDRILASVETLNLQGVATPLDLSLCAHMPNLRDVIAPARAVTITSAEALLQVPRLRLLVLTDGAFTAKDLGWLSAQPSLSQLHLNGMHLSRHELISLNEARKLKELTLHRVTGVTADDIAELTSITRLRLSELAEGDLAPLRRMPRLRHLGLTDLVPHNLEFLAAPKLISFSSDDRALDERRLDLLRTKTQLQELGYAIRDFSLVAGCAKLSIIRADGSAKVNFEPIRHLPIKSVGVYFSPDETTADSIIAAAEDTWPGLRSTTIRMDWKTTSPTNRSPESAPPARSEAVAEAPNASRAGFLGRLLGKWGGRGSAR